MKKGFTLAEVLIALGIVGIVAVLTIPGIMRDYKNRSYVALLQETHSQLSNATQAAMADELSDNFYETKSGAVTSCTNFSKGDCQKGMAYFLSTYMDPVKYNCGRGSDLCVAGAAVDSYKTLSGANAGGVIDSDCVLTAKGAAVCAWFNPYNSTASLWVDVNGKEPPNVVGRDVFSMDIKTDGSISDYGAGNIPGVAGCVPSHCSTDGAGSMLDIACGCLNNVMEAGWKMEY